MNALPPPGHMLSAHVEVERRYQRSVRLDADLGVPGVLRGYVPHASARAVLETTAQLIEGGQGAFTWTGPYGGGKSSLALALASYVAPLPEAQAEASDLIGDVPGLGRAFAARAEGWLIVVLTGRRADPVIDLREALAGAIAAAPGRARTRRPRTLDPAGRDVVERLEREAEARPGAGVLVVVDELGKYLEATAGGLADPHIFQDLAESANRSEGRLILVGVLHQAFERYAERLGTRVQDEWAKIQGRYVDVPVVTATDEVLALLGRAITVRVRHPESRPAAERVAAAIAARRPGSAADLADRLDACWPLHPVTAALLGPVSRRRFGQNERSVFGFLASAEPGGFGEFLMVTPRSSGRTFGPAELWDYLRLNLEPAILASPDGHRWAQAADAVERASRRGGPLNERLIKSVAVIDLFGGGSGLVAEGAVLASCAHGEPENEVRTVLEDLAAASVVVFRRHLDAHAVYGGSDFDIEAALGERLSAREELDLAALHRVADLRPVHATAHHHRTGTPRWFELSLAELDVGGVTSRDLRVPLGAAGAFRLVLPSADLSEEEALETARLASLGAGDLPVVVGVPPGHEALRASGRELVALHEVRQGSSELEGDAVARREVDSRLEYVATRLEETLRMAQVDATWFCRGERLDPGPGPRSLSRMASALADRTFPEAPVIHSELINRQKPSSNTHAALKPLLKGMVDGAGRAAFGIKGYPPERGLVATVLEGPGLYVAVGDGWRFTDPIEEDGPASFAPVWRAADALLTEGSTVTAATIYEAWSRAPIGLRRGVMPILLVAYLATRRDRMALYLNGMFQAVLGELMLDRLLQDPRDLALRAVPDAGSRGATHAAYADAVEGATGRRPPAESLPLAQALVEFAFALPPWTRVARGALSEAAVKVRHALMHAHDPHALLGEDLPQTVEADMEEAPALVSEVLQELAGAYPTMLANLRTKLLDGLKHRGDDLAPLRRRARAIRGGGGSDLKLQGFITRLTEYDGSLEQTAGLCGLVADKPMSDWGDLEPGRAGVHLADYAHRFRQVELFGDMTEPTQTAVMMMAGVGSAERSVVRRAQVALEDARGAEPVVERLIAVLDEADLEPDLVLAVLAEVAQRRLKDDGETDPMASEDATNRAGEVGS